MIRILRAVLGAFPFMIAVPCALIAPLWVFGIPGNPTTFELLWFLASFTMIAGYPVIVFTLGIKLWRARRGKSASDPKSLRRQIWIALALLLLVQSPIAFMVYADWRRSVEWWETASPEDRLWRAATGADGERLEQVLDEGADIDLDLFNGETAVLLLARADSWTLVEMLLERGADPDRPDDRGETLRSYVAGLEGRTRPDEEAALRHVRERLAAPE